MFAVGDSGRSRPESGGRTISVGPREAIQPGGRPAPLPKLPGLSRGQVRSFDRLRRSWAELAEDAFDWAILGVDTAAAEPGVDRFLETGEELWSSARRRAAELGLTTGGAAALDFGCGPGRVTQALSRHFGRVQGIDAAPGMVRLARRIDQSAGKCQFQIWDLPDLSGIPDSHFDLSFSAFVFQHLPLWLTKRYVAELVRVTRPGGTLILQHHSGPTARVVGMLPPELVSLGSEWAGRLGIGPRSRRRWEDHWLPPEGFASLLRASGARLDASDRAPRPEGRMVSYWYYAHRT